MKLFRCSCPGNPVLYFENTHCHQCNRVTGFSPDTLSLLPVREDSSALPNVWIDDQALQYRRCKNWLDHQACNWLLPYTADGYHEAALCQSCSLNAVIPDLSVPEHLPLWRSMEQAKRRCLFSLLELGLPVGDQDMSTELAPLRFQFLHDSEAATHFRAVTHGQDPVVTGHENGVITINLAEADDVARIQMRTDMGEPYRTLLGHFRHETAHYYWDVFQQVNPAFLQQFRSIFGDETEDYSLALERHYSQGTAVNWHEAYITSYASSHPWEDWAETFAHYLHILDTLETLHSFSSVSNIINSQVSNVTLPFNGGPGRHQPLPNPSDFDDIVSLWINTSILLNGLNRSMGLDDPYPFILQSKVVEKLRFIHLAVQQV